MLRIALGISVFLLDTYIIGISNFTLEISSPGKPVLPHPEGQYAAGLDGQQAISAPKPSL
jgi:hypothetical protein